jgi:hypothetical protein
MAHHNFCERSGFTGAGPMTFGCQQGREPGVQWGALIE